MKQLQYTPPVICKTNPKDWYIYFSFTHAGKLHEYKKREGINRIQDKRERQREAEALAASRLVWLESGWNPALLKSIFFRSFYFGFNPHPG
jgi:hypothetical protein